MSATVPAGLNVVLDHGIGVFPCRTKTLDPDHKAKSPLTSNGLNDASTDRAQIADWARRHPDCAWGAAMTAEITAIDIDVKPGRNGFDSLTEILAEHGDLPRTLTNNTPSGGQHRLFRFGKALKNSTGLAAGIDIKSKGGYVLVPPSVIETGAYRWDDPRIEIALAPEWLTAEIVQRSGNRSSRHISEGQRNDTLYRYACGLRARNVPKDDAWDALVVRNQDCDPALDLKELRQILENAFCLPPGFPLTDLGNAERMVAFYGQDWRYLPEIGWMHWDGVTWREDRLNRIFVVATNTVRGISASAAAEDDNQRRQRLVAHALRSESRRAMDAMVALARVQPDVSDLLENYDQQPTLLAVANGVVNLDDGILRLGQREDRLRLRAAVRYELDAGAPRFLQFLDEIFASDRDLIAFMARAFGYSGSGLNTEQALFIAHGTGANGKSTLTNVVRQLLGDYSKAIQPESLLVRERSTISNDIARLVGVRFVPTVEVEEGKKLAESLVKQLTGGDAISARFLHREFFDFVPQAKLWISTNHRPLITGTDHAIWRRIFLVPFNVTIPQDRRDKDLERKLMAEGPGILNWLIAGFREWRQVGLAPPQSVMAATDQYRKDMDRVGQFLAECTQRNDAFSTKCSDVYRAYVGWSLAAGVRPLSRPRFRDKAQNEHGLRIAARDGYDRYAGVLLTTGGEL